jgi:hypothetical protein
MPRRPAPDVNPEKGLRNRVRELRSKNIDLDDSKIFAT